MTQSHRSHRFMCRVRRLSASVELCRCEARSCTTQPPSLTTTSLKKNNHHPTSPMSCENVKAVVVLDNDGKRLHAKYYSSELSSKTKQEALEAKLILKRKDAGSGHLDANVILLDGTVSVFRTGTDGTTLYIVGSANENELILAAAVDGLYDALDMLLPGDALDKRTILENYEYLFLLVDELVDGGIILEKDPKALCSRVLMKGSDGVNTPTAELTIGQAMGVVREQLTKSFR